MSTAALAPRARLATRALGWSAGVYAGTLAVALVVGPARPAALDGRVGELADAVQIWRGNLLFAALVFAFALVARRWPAPTRAGAFAAVAGVLALRAGLTLGGEVGGGWAAAAWIGASLPHGLVELALICLPLALGGRRPTWALATLGAVGLAGCALFEVFVTPQLTGF